MLKAFRAAARFFRKNLFNLDPRSTNGRHPWRWVVFVFVDTLIAMLPFRAKGRGGTVVVLVNRLGDAVVGKPLIDALERDALSTGEPFVVLAGKNWSCLSDNVYVKTKCHFIDEDLFCLNLLYRIRVALWLRHQGFKTAICFMHHRLEMRDDALVVLTGARNKIVAALPFQSERWYPWIFEHYLSEMTLIVDPMPYRGVAEIFDPERGIWRDVPHAFQRFQHFYGELTGGRQLAPTLNYPIPRLKKADRPFVILNIGASSGLRRWPLAEFGTVARKILQLGMDVIFLGGPAEQQFRREALRIAQDLNSLESSNGPSVRVLINELDFIDVIDTIRISSCVVGADTGISHLAMWMGTPTVTLLQSSRLTDSFHRVGDFFPYPVGLLATKYRAVWSTPIEFHRKNGNPGVANDVWLAVKGNVASGLISQAGSGFFVELGNSFQ